MLEAQEMFRTANKVTRPEKALILGFMAGSRGKYFYILICQYITILGNVTLISHKIAKFCFIFMQYFLKFVPFICEFCKLFNFHKILFHFHAVLLNLYIA